MTILILGGTTEATALAALVHQAGLRAVLSYAGRTSRPMPQPIPTRTGGFGGVSGLADFLRTHRITALVDATHPFATQIKENALEAARKTGTPHLAVLRPPWVEREGDQWQRVPSMRAAAEAIGPTPRRVLLTVGQKEVAAFHGLAHQYVVRSVETVTGFAGMTVIEARGPFDEAEERALLEQHRIEVVVSKNSGGAATRGKIDAARALGIPVILVERPALPADLARVETEGAAMAWLLAHAGTQRGE